MSRPHIAVVTPLFPLREEPYRGSFVHSTVVELQELANVKVYVPVAAYPKRLRPRSFQYRKPDLDYRPPGVQCVTYFEYPVIPVLTRPVNAYTSGHVLLKYLRASRPDLVLAYWLYPEGYGAVKAARSIGVPCVVGSRGSDLKVVGDKISLYFTQRCVTEAGRVITVSEDLRQQAIRFGAKPSNVTTVLNGCDGSIFHSSDKEAARRYLNVNPASQVILFVGHLFGTKGLRELMQAFKQLASFRKNLEMVIVGEGNLADELASSAAAADLTERVRLVGACNRHEVAQWMAACDVFCLPSYSEGCPNVVLEALSCDRPVVATNVGGIPEIVNSQCGYLVPPRDESKLAEALQLALDRDWTSNSIAQTFQRGWDIVARETFAVCIQLLPKQMQVFGNLR